MQHRLYLSALFVLKCAFYCDFCSEKTPAIEFMSDLLQRAGYNYLGNETMYSGVDGRPFEVRVLVLKVACVI